LKIKLLFCFREFFVAFYNLPSVDRIRSLKTDRIGRLVSVIGTVTRASEVRPELLYASFTCKKCGTLHAAVEQQFQFTEPHRCRHPNCQSNMFQMLVGQSIFVDWQRLRVQENADEIPPGSMPRCLDIICRNASVETAKAGDKVVFTGMVAVVPDSAGLARAGEATVGGKDGGGTRGGEGLGDAGVQGLKGMGCKEMTYKMLFIACSIQQLDARGALSTGGSNNLAANCFYGKSERNADGKIGEDHGTDYAVHESDPNSAESILLDLTDMQKAEIASMRNSPHLYARMVDSICPTVFGHSEVKRGILLMLFGGVHKKTTEGTSLRGDINVCIVGDPSCAKSQFLKYVHGFLPRCIYTSGKSSSAAGLTASVIKDAETVSV
jgi:DNA replication licensing factor MCM6